MRIRARRLLKAIGVDIQMLPPFPISSNRVRSVAVSDPVLTRAEFLESDAPVYVIGSGKTAMDLEGTRMFLRQDGRAHDVSVAEGAWFVNCTTHFRHFPHEPLLADGGIVCAPQFALGFTGTTAYFLTHLWFRGDLEPLARELFRARVDVEPKLRFLPHLALMVVANLAMVGARTPLSIQSAFEGDLQNWYPTYRKLPMIARLLATRREVVTRATRHLVRRYSDAPEPT